MIKINFTPEDELDNPLWFVPDLAFGVLVLTVLLACIQAYVLVRHGIEINLNAQAEKFNLEAKQHETELKKLEEIATELGSIKEKLDEVKPLTETHVSRYMPVIVVEHLQNLKPEGLWFSRIEMVPDAGPQQKKDAKTRTVPVATNSTLLMNGYALDHLLVAEFLTALRATQVQDVDAADPRTQVYFDSVVLDSSSSVQAAGALNGAYKAPKGMESEKVIQFELRLGFKTRDANSAHDALTALTIDEPNVASSQDAVRF